MAALHSILFPPHPPENERLEAPFQQAAAFLVKNHEWDCTRLFFSFLDTFGKGVRRDQEDTLSTHSFTLLDRDLLPCGRKVKSTLLKRAILKAYDARSVSAQQQESFLQVRLFFVLPEQSSATDSASLRHYQKGKIDPETSLPLDYFSFSFAQREFIAVEIHTLMGDALVPIAEYLCPCNVLSSAKATADAFIQDPSPVQIRRMDKKLIGASLNDIAKLFDKIVKVENGPYTDETLKRDLATLVHKWVFTNPYKSGEESFVHLMQESLAFYHGFHLAIKENTNVYHEALAKPNFPTFWEKYNQIVSLSIK